MCTMNVRFDRTANGAINRGLRSPRLVAFLRVETEKQAVMNDLNCGLVVVMSERREQLLAFREERTRRPLPKQNPASKHQCGAIKSCAYFSSWRRRNAFELAQHLDRVDRD